MGMMSIWQQITTKSLQLSPPTTSRLFSTYPYVERVGIREFLKGIDKGLGVHVQKLEDEFVDLQKLLVVRTLKLKKLEIPGRHRRLILKYARLYRVGLWRPRADVVRD